MYIGVAGYVAMLVTQDVKIGALSKLLAESLRIAYYRKTDANDMARLSVFFIVASTIALLK